MANRPVFIPVSKADGWVQENIVDFTWYPGFSVSQKRKSIESLHAAIRSTLGIENILEVSSKSELSIGINLSAFHLGVNGKTGDRYVVEGLFQGSKVFENGGPYVDLHVRAGRDAKTDERLKDSGELIGFSFRGENWPLEPKTAFYDWIYLNVLSKNLGLVDKVINYEAFTDIEFNPRRSINCQAQSVARYVALAKEGKLEEAMSSMSAFLSVAYSDPNGFRSQEGNEQLDLL